MVLSAFKIVKSKLFSELGVKIANLGRQMGERFVILVFLAP